MAKDSKKMRALKKEQEVKKNTVPRIWNGDVLDISSFFPIRRKKYEVAKNGKNSDVYYRDKFIGTFNIDSYLMFGDYILLKSSGYNRWSLFCEEQAANKKFVKEGNFFVHLDDGGVKNIIFYDEEMNNISSLSIEEILVFAKNYFVLKQKDGNYIIARTVHPFLLTILREKNNLVKILQNSDNHEDVAFLSLGDGFYKCLGKPTEKMQFCSMYDLNYKMRTFSDFKLYIRAKLLDL